MGSLKKHIEQFERTLLKEADNLQTNSERMFNGDRVLEKIEEESFGFKGIKELHRKELEEKDRIIEKLKEELKSQWLTNKTAFNTKKLYEDKIKKMEVVDTTKLISTLVDVVRYKQGKQKLDWKSWLEIPESKYLLQINESLAKKIFEENNRLITIREQRKFGSSVVTQPNYSLKFTGDVQAGARADLVSTNFNPNDPTSVGFSSSDRIPLAKSGFTISYWFRPDESENLDGAGFAMGWKYGGGSRFDFGLRNPSRPYFGVGSNAFGTYESHNTWAIMTQNSGFIDNYNIDDYLDGDGHIILNKWYHIVITYVGSAPDGTTNNETDRIRRIYLDGYQIFGQKDEAIGTAYNNWHNVDHPGKINWTANLDEQLTRGFSFGMRALKGSGTTDGVANAKYNHGLACGLDEVAIYNELKDNDWVRSVYDGGTKYNHKGTNNLVGYWRFNEGSGTRVEDLSGYGNHGTFTNGLDAETVQDNISDIASGVPTWEKR